MILVNGKDTTPDELAQMFNLPLDDIRKCSEFIINEDLKGYDLGSRKKRDLGPNTFPAVFFTEDVNGRTVEIRYAKSRTKRKDKNDNFHEVFSPRKVTFEGNETIPDNIGLAIYFYIHPKCKTSPFRKSGLWTYQFVDKKAIAQKSIDKGHSMREALNHAAETKGRELRLIAKGIKVGEMTIVGVDAMSELEVQAAMSNIAMYNPSEYLKQVSTQITKFQGRIVDAVDKNIFRLDTTSGTHKWVWQQGKQKGQLVCEITNPTVTPQEFLMAHIKANINSYHADILAIQEEIDTNANAENFLSSVAISNAVKTPLVFDKKIEEVIVGGEDDLEDELVETEVFTEYDEDKKNDDNISEEHKFNIPPQVIPEPPFPTDFKSSMVYLTHFKGSNPANIAGKKLLDALEAEDLQPSTIRDWVKQNMEY